jgi:protein ImuA
LLACFDEGLRHGGLGAVVAEVARLSICGISAGAFAPKSARGVGVA